MSATPLASCTRRSSPALALIHSYVAESLHKLWPLQLLGLGMYHQDPLGTCPSASRAWQRVSPKGPM